MITSLHTTTELEQLLGERVSLREPLHAWPLSQVEKLTTEGGARFIYKVQRAPTVEPEFLTQVQSPLLPPCTVLWRDPDQAALLFPFLTAPTLKSQALDVASLVAVGRELLQEIGALGTATPVYRDLSTLALWQGFVEETLGMLTALVDRGIFVQTTHEQIDAVRSWAARPDVRATLSETSQLIHGDLKVEHVFCPATGYQVIDWQRPYRAPREIDLALLLESQGISPEGYVSPAALGVRWFLLLHWAVEAKTHLLPTLPFFENWVQNALREIRNFSEQRFVSTVY